MIGEKGSELETVAVANDKTLTSDSNGKTAVKKVLGKKTPSKLRPSVLVSLKSKGRSKDTLSNPDTNKKFKRNKELSTFSHSNGGFKISSSLPSAASTISTEGN